MLKPLVAFAALLALTLLLIWGFSNPPSAEELQDRPPDPCAGELDC